MEAAITPPEEREFVLAMVLLAEYACAIGAAPINTLPSVWTHEIDPEWFVAVNGHKTPRSYTDPSGVMHWCNPFEAHVWRRGWPAMILSPVDGFVAGGQQAPFIELLERKLAQLPRWDAEGPRV